MCSDCLKEDFPDRESVCLDNGSYLRNFAGCSQCGEKTAISIHNRVTTEDELGEEKITYQHMCKTCNHLVANHEHLFRVDEDFQVYEMFCSLCGRAEDERSIMPIDPRGPKEII